MDGKFKVIHGALCVVSADNLGSLAVGGFKESCTSYRCCRHCMAVQDTARSKVSHIGSIFWQFLSHDYSSRRLNLY